MAEARGAAPQPSWQELIMAEACEEQGGARGRQEGPGGARRGQERPGGARGRETPGGGARGWAGAGAGAFLPADAAVIHLGDKGAEELEGEG